MAPHCNCFIVKLRFGGLFEGFAGDSNRSLDRSSYGNGSQCPPLKSDLSIIWVPARKKSMLVFGRLTGDKTQHL